MTRRLTFVFVMLAVAAVWTLAVGRDSTEQPMAFDHARHEGLACAVCHQGIETAARAGIPDGALCQQCHATAPSARGADAVWRELQSGGTIGWQRLTRMPDHVMFSHRRHVAIANLDCASCHGDVGRQTEPPAAALVRLDMDTCITCHRQEGVSDDCAACHR